MAATSRLVLTMDLDALKTAGGQATVSFKAPRSPACLQPDAKVV
jgi:hypothetical protein